MSGMAGAETTSITAIIQSAPYSLHDSAWLQLRRESRQDWGRIEGILLEKHLRHQPCSLNANSRFGEPSRCFSMASEIKSLVANDSAKDIPPFYPKYVSKARIRLHRKNF